MFPQLIVNCICQYLSEEDLMEIQRVWPEKVEYYLINYLRSCPIERWLNDNPVIEKIKKEVAPKTLQQIQQVELKAIKLLIDRVLDNQDGDALVLLSNYGAKPICDHRKNLPQQIDHSDSGKTWLDTFSWW